MLGPRAAGEWSAQDRIQLGVLLRTSFGAVLWSIAPLVLSSAGLGEAAVWALSSGGYLAFIFVVLSTVTALFRQGPAASGTSRAVWIYARISVALQVMLLLANLVALRTAWPHLVAILLSLAASAFAFVRLLVGTRNSSP